MADSTLWWLLAGAAVAIELLTGTFYLLMLGIGMAAGALAAHAGASIPTQLVVAAFVGGGAVAAWHVIRPRFFPGAAPGSNTNLDFDAGEPVHVAAWTAENTAQVRYRGTVWTAVPADGTPQGTGAHRVRAVDGSRLVVEKI
jgi:membrane protein implicated in regulation of membrane protease activity